jgi:hypothetical protein
MDYVINSGPKNILSLLLIQLFCGKCFYCRYPCNFFAGQWFAIGRPNLVVAQIIFALSSQYLWVSILNYVFLVLLEKLWEYKESLVEMVHLLGAFVLGCHKSTKAPHCQT